MDLVDRTPAVVGLGYMGLRLAVEFGRFRPVISHDIDLRRSPLRLGATDGLDGGQE